MRAARIAASTGLALALCVAAQAQATVTFHFEDPRMQPAKYTITLHEDGTGHFHAEGGSTSPDDTAALPSEGQDRPIQGTAETVAHIFAVARGKKFFNIA